MTDEPAAIISGSLVDVRNVGTHKCVKLTIHVPEEYALRVVDVFGWPTAVAPVSVALARMLTEPELVKGLEERGYLPKPEQSIEPTKERRAWATLTPTVQAGIRCQDPIFQAYVIEQRKFEEVDDMEDNAACFVRRQCNVNTRGALATNEKAATVWKSIDSDFQVWKLAEAM